MNSDIKFSIKEIAAALNIAEKEINRIQREYNIKDENGYLSNAQVKFLICIIETMAENARKAADDYLDKMVKANDIIIETSALLEESAPEFLDNIAPHLKAASRVINIPSSVLSELMNHKAKESSMAQRADEVIRKITNMSRNGMAAIRGEMTEKFDANQCVQIAVQYITETNILIITQKNELSNDLLKLNKLRSVNGKRLSVGRINRYGYLNRFKSDIYSEGVQNVSGYSAGYRTSGSNPFVSRTYTISKGRPVGGFDKPLNVSSIPEEGDKVIDAKGSIYRLASVISKGGEGTVYELEDGTVAKIYHPDKLSKGRFEKLKLMVERPIIFEGLCWPTELLYNFMGEFIGYRMVKARGKELDCTVFNPKLLEKTFPNWKKIDTVRLCISILEKISFLHSQGVILSDISGTNILVESPEKVWFVDCDSYQVEDYVCPMGTVHFTPPELQGVNFSTVLRTLGNENYSVAVLLFMIMLPGQNPYNQMNSDNIRTAIREMNFPYARDRNDSDENAPAGKWTCIWSHLPRYIRDNFYAVFDKDGDRNAEENRITANEWLKVFRYYHKQLESGTFQESDEQSAEIFPTSFRTTQNMVKHSIMTLTCPVCGSTFKLTDGEVEWYNENNLKLPKLCRGCREQRKQLRRMA